MLLAISRGWAQLAAASPPQSSPLELLAEWGVNGEGPGELAEPVGLAVDLNDRVYLADRRSRLLQKFESTGVPSLAVVSVAARVASAVAVDSGGAIYVVDARGGRVWIHFPDGDLLRNFRVTPQRGADASFGIGITDAGRILVPNTAGGRIQVFTPAGRLENTWRLPAGPSGRPARPTAVSAGVDDSVYIADQSGAIVRYTTGGVRAAVWDAPADSSGPLRGIAASRAHVFALRGARPQLEVWTFDGRRVLTDNLGGRFEAEPPALYLAVSRDEQVFVLDAARPRVFRFRLRLPAQ